MRDTANMECSGTVDKQGERAYSLILQSKYIWHLCALMNSNILYFYIVAFIVVQQ